MEMLSISSTAPFLSVKPTTGSLCSKPLRPFFKPLNFSSPSSRSLSVKTSLNPPRRTIASVTVTNGLEYGLELPRVDDYVQMSDAKSQNESMRRAVTDPMGLLLQERIVFLGYEIDDFVADAIISQMLLLDAQDPTKDIRLFINSPGGSMSSTMAIYDVIQLVRADVSTVAIGIVASTASIILGGGTNGKRLAMPNTRIMVHQPLGGASGMATDVEVQAAEIMNNKKSAIGVISSFTGRSYDEVEKFIDRDRYMSPAEAMEFGMLDGVIDRDSVVPLKPEIEKVKTRSYTKKINSNTSQLMRPDIPNDEMY